MYNIRIEISTHIGNGAISFEYGTQSALKAYTKLPE